MTANEVEIAVARHFGYRQNVVVPNVSWGLGISYEADLVVLRASGFCFEVEIKVTRSDIRADLRKRHKHDGLWFRQLWFAVPRDLADDPNIPQRAGVLAVESLTRVIVVRVAALNAAARKMPDAVQRKLLHLASMRTWTLKEALLSAQNNRLYHNRKAAK